MKVFWAVFPFLFIFSFVNLYPVSAVDMGWSLGVAMLDTRNLPARVSHQDASLGIALKPGEYQVRGE